jgi:hypothetical protein
MLILDLKWILTIILVLLAAGVGVAQWISRHTARARPALTGTPVAAAPFGALILDGIEIAYVNPYAPPVALGRGCDTPARYRMGSGAERRPPNGLPGVTCDRSLPHTDLRLGQDGALVDHALRAARRDLPARRHGLTAHRAGRAHAGQRSLTRIAHAHCHCPHPSGDPGPR